MSNTNMEELKVKHTTNQWRVMDGAILSDKINDYGNFIVVSCERERTAQDDKNLALIAAAPELKEMLSLAVCYVDNEEVKNQIYRLLGKIDGVGDTFVKTEGRS